MVSFLNLSFYVISLFTMLSAFLFSLGISGFLICRIKTFLGDYSSEIEGFDTINPLAHIEPIMILLFIFTKIFIKKAQPCIIFWKDGIKGIFEKAIYFFGQSVFHLIFASITLFIGYKLYGIEFIFLSKSTDIAASSNFVKVVKSLFIDKSSFNIIIILLMLYNIASNMFLAVFNFIINILDYFINKYFSQSFDNWKITILSCLIFAFILYYYMNFFSYIAWRIVILPLQIFY